MFSLDPLTLLMLSCRHASLPHSSLLLSHPLSLFLLPSLLPSSHSPFFALFYTLFITPLLHCILCSSFPPSDTPLLHSYQILTSCTLFLHSILHSPLCLTSYPLISSSHSSFSLLQRSLRTLPPPTPLTFHTPPLPLTRSPHLSLY